MRRLRFTRAHRAFTLVELLIVIIIIAVLAAIVIPKFADSGLRSKEAALKADLRLMRNTIELFHHDTGAWPAAISDLDVTTAPATGLDSGGGSKAITAANFRGPYLHSLENDPVGGAAFNYDTGSPTVGKVWSSAPGTALDGTNYSDW
ncbi:MAG: prepilin-type N-terminal cleavage/methylation domain-containing protein [Armatimonadetes bacterium]|nr:prepilin-type N-terminal cleavage/methylation domain-containing protein [Armatimonadota bacterium]